MSWEIRCGDALEVLRTLPGESVQACVTSPPYWGLRDYGTGTWEGGDPACTHEGRQKPRQDTTGAGEGHGRFSGTRGTQAAKRAHVVPVRGICRCGAKRIDQQLGVERTPGEYVARLVEVLGEVRRVLRKDGTLWLNLGDCYAESGRGGNPGQSAHVKQRTNEGSPGVRRSRAASVSGLKKKDLVGVPWMVAFALRDAGWWLRMDVVWEKLNPMPESVADRPTRSHEYVFLLTKSARYFFDGAAVREPDKGRDHPRKVLHGQPSLEPTGVVYPPHRGLRTVEGRDGLGRNIRSVWPIATQPFPGAHFATFPPVLAERCILAGSREGDIVLDPFAGAGTTGLVASRLGRSFVGIELNPAYVVMAARRIHADAPLLSVEASA